MILIGDNNGYPGLSYDLIRDFKDCLKSTRACDCKMGIAMFTQMIRHRTPGRLNGIGLGFNTGRLGAQGLYNVCTPVSKANACLLYTSRCV